MTYDASSIQWLQDDIAKVQGNTSLYVGTSGPAAVQQCVIEVVGNSGDEASSGHGDTIVVKVDRDHTVTVWDFGRGIPVGRHPEYPDFDVLTILCTKLHTSGKKSDQSGYSEGTIGTHGVGMTVVNATSDFMQVWTNNNPRATYTQRFERGVATSDVVRTKSYPVPPYIKAKPGTVVQWRSDFTRFDHAKGVDWATLVAWIKDASWFLFHNTIRAGKVTERRNVRFILVGPDGKGAKIQRGGLGEFFEATINAINATVPASHAIAPVVFDTALVAHTPNIDCVLGWTSHPDQIVKCYVNAVHNPQGGSHQEALLKCIDTVFRKYARPNQKFRVVDLMAGAVGCINMRIKEPKFDSQSKVRLMTPVIETVREQLLPILEKWARANAAGIRELIDRAVQINALSANALNDRRIAAALKVKVKGKILLPPKLLVSHTTNPAERELFLVEGDSAKGGCDVASNRYYQEVLPLRGKLPNMMRPEKKKNGEPINDTIVDVLKATGITPSTRTERMRVGKILLLNDADPDGGHIASLLCSLFLHYAPELFEQGKVFFVDTPLYAHQTKTGVKTYARDYAGIVEKLGDKINAAGSTLTRAKGLGELNSDILKDVVFNPRTRRLVQLTPEAAREKVKQIMGEDRTLVQEMLGV